MCCLLGNASHNLTCLPAQSQLQCKPTHAPVCHPDDNLEVCLWAVCAQALRQHSCKLNCIQQNGGSGYCRRRWLPGRSKIFTRQHQLPQMHPAGKQLLHELLQLLQLQRRLCRQLRVLLLLLQQRMQQLSRLALS